MGIESSPFLGVNINIFETTTQLISRFPAPRIHPQWPSFFFSAAKSSAKGSALTGSAPIWPAGQVLWTHGFHWKKPMSLVFGGGPSWILVVLLSFVLPIFFSTRDIWSTTFGEFGQEFSATKTPLRSDSWWWWMVDVYIGDYKDQLPINLTDICNQKISANTSETFTKY